MKQSLPLSGLSTGFLFAIASAALFAIRPIFVKLVYIEGIDPTTLIAFRMLFSLPIYLIFLGLLLKDPDKRARLTTSSVIAAVVIGFLGYYFASFLDLIGLQYVTSQLGRLVLYVYPTFVVLIGAMFFGQKITPKLVLAMLITYSGIAVIFGHDLREYGSDVINGSLFILSGAFCFAIYLSFSKNLISQLGSRLFTCIALISASIGILIHYSITHSITSPEVTQTGLLWILVIAIFCTVIPTFFTTAAVERIGSNKTGIISMIGPAFTSAFAVMILSESFTIYHLLGILLTVFGIWVLSKS